MNERIKRLAEQAKFTWIENDKDITGGVDLEKFAELIVRECAELARQINLDGMDRSLLVHKKIKQHFGIKI